MPATINDVARRAGVSTATVSRVLSGVVPARPATRERVLVAVRELGYRPSGVARSLKLRRTGTIGVIISDIENPYFAEMVRSVEDVARELGYALLLCNGAEDPEREAAYLEVLAERRVDGIVVATAGVGQRHAEWLARAPLPVVMMNSEAPVASVPAILSDNLAGGRLAADHLLDLGHRVVGHLTAPASSTAVAQRLAGVRSALAGRGLDPGALGVAEGNGHVAGGEVAMSALLAERPAVTGVVCYNDLMAIGALRALRGSGRRVPHDVSVVGFDGLDLTSYTDPTLTTIVQQRAEMARWAIDRLARLIAEGRHEDGTTAGDRPAAEVVRLPVELVIRESTGRPPGG